MNRIALILSALAVFGALVFVAWQGIAGYSARRREDAADRQRMADARAEGGPNVPWEEVKGPPPCRYAPTLGGSWRCEVCGGVRETDPANGRHCPGSVPAYPAPRRPV